MIKIFPFSSVVAACPARSVLMRNTPPGGAAGGRKRRPAGSPVTQTARRKPEATRLAARAQVADHVPRPNAPLPTIQLRVGKIRAEVGSNHG